MTFLEWLTDEMRKRGMSQSQLAKFSGITPAQISRILNGERNPGESALIGFAKAFNIAPETVFEKAGILPPSTTKDLSPIKRKLLQLTEDLPDSDIDIAIALLEQRKEFHKKNYQSNSAK